MPALQLRELCVGLGELLFELDRLAVAQLGRLAEVGGALGAIGLGANLFELRLERADAADDLFLLVPARPQRGALLG